MINLKMIKAHMNRKLGHFRRIPFQTACGLLFLFNRYRTTDAYLMGFPKTGNSWLRFMIGSYIQLVCNLDQPPLFESFDLFGRCEKPPIGPSMIASHGPLEWSSQERTDLNQRNVVSHYINKKVVLLVRHPLDTMVSGWFHAKSTGFDGNFFRGGLEDFLNDPVFGLDKFFRFYQIWKDERHRFNNLILVRYEDTRKAPIRQLKRILHFLELPIISPYVERTVKQSSFKQMQKLEMKENLKTEGKISKTLFNYSGNNNSDSFRVRKGKVGGYRDYLTNDIWCRYEDRIAHEMPHWYGY